MHRISGICLCLAAAALMTSCLSAVKPDGGHGIITFTPVLGTEVRSGDSDKPFPEDMDFGVWALDGSGTAFMDCEQVSFDGSCWTTAEPFEWPDESLRFIACAPHSSGVSLGSEGNILIGDYELQAFPEGLYVTEMTPAVRRTDSTVHLPFRRATAMIDFRVANGLNEATSVTIEKIILKGIYVRGSFDSSADPQWNLAGEPMDVTVYDSSRDGAGPEAVRKPQPYGGTLEIIPQQSKPVVEVAYSFQTADSEWLSGQRNRTAELQAKWEPGRHYTYTLTITETIIRHSAGISTANQ